jgi:pimeloyl-ACP methyl ester carboxylesterase
MIRRILLSIVAAVLILGIIAGAIAWRSQGTFAIDLPDTLVGEEPGDLVSVERYAWYARPITQYLWNSIELPVDVEINHGFVLYRVLYRTTNHDGSIVTASGLVATPTGEGFNSVVAYFHGTNPHRESSVSQPGLNEGSLLGVAASGSGHYVIAPDYIGLGESLEQPPYMHMKTTVDNSIDLLTAGYALIEHLRGERPDTLYLTGFSQGGKNTLDVQRELETRDENPFPVAASAPIAGPFHLHGISWPQALTGETDSHEFYLGYITTAYAHIYKQPIETLLAEDYVETIPPVFDGSQGSKAINAVLPDLPRELLHTDLLDAHDNNKPHWFLDALKENTTTFWAPKAPIRIYYGDDDIDVLPKEALEAAKTLTELGGDVTTISVGPYAHEDSAFRSLPTAINWFTELENQ